ncbi:MAG: cobalamin biosynthesis protein P47K [Verrucomicrobiales bacterium]|nr:cobalamin biosynthesis protein P47K [Verrucomicrobiales bacterium]
MIGGFLGAGKTTVIQRFARYLDDRNHTVGLITNDQGAGLVDSAIGRSNEFPVEEISGGCFCCRFNSLIDAARNLTAETRPDAFLAEPVGSCTDLVATVSLPLQKIYGDDYVVAPLSVLVDSVRARRVLELDPDGRKFSPNVTYIYRKQLEEAENIVINKIDLLDDESLAGLRDAMAREFPEAKIFEISARDGTGCEEWFEAVLNAEMNVGRFLEIDYQRYGDGEALLGWLNMTVEMEAENDEEEFDGNELLKSIAVTLRETMQEAGAEVAHLKMTLTPLGDPMEIAAINLVRGDSEPEQSHHLLDPLDDGELLLNIRAETDPDTLESAARKALQAEIVEARGLKMEISHAEHFRPGMPKPTHRMTEA